MIIPFLVFVQTHSQNMHKQHKTEYHKKTKSLELVQEALIPLLGNGDTYKTFKRVITQRKNRITHYPSQ